MDVEKFLLFLYCSLCSHRVRRIARGGDLSSELAYGNHPSVALHDDVVHDKVCTGAIHGRALVFDSRFAADIRGLRVSPLAVVLEPKFRIIHDLTFACAGDRTSVNDDSDFCSAPPCELGHVLSDVSLRVLFLRQRHGSTARILLCRVDVKDAFRQVPVDPAGEPTFGYVVGGHVVVNFAFEVRVAEKPRVLGIGLVCARTFSHSLQFSRRCGVPARGRCRRALGLAPSRDSPVVSLPRECKHVPRVGGNTESYFFVKYYVDDGNLSGDRR